MGKDTERHHEFIYSVNISNVSPISQALCEHSRYSEEIKTHMVPVFVEFIF